MKNFISSSLATVIASVLPPMMKLAMPVSLTSILSRKRARRQTNRCASFTLMVLLAGSGAVLAGEHQGGMNHAAMQGAQDNASAMHHAEGVVNSIDMERGKINMTHGPVKSLGWPGMTMDFKVKDNAILKGVKPGQKVKFDIEKEGGSQFSITRIVPLK